MITIYLLLIISFGLLTYGLYDYSKKDRENRNKLQQGYSHAEYLGGTPYFSAPLQGYMRPTKTAACICTWIINTKNPLIPTGIILE